MGLFSKSEPAVGTRAFVVSTEDGEQHQVYAYDESHAGRMVENATGVPPVDVWRPRR